MAASEGLTHSPACDERRRVGTDSGAPTRSPPGHREGLSHHPYGDPRSSTARRRLRVSSDERSDLPHHHPIATVVPPASHLTHHLRSWTAAARRVCRHRHRSSVAPRAGTLRFSASPPAGSHRTKSSDAAAARVSPEAWPAEPSTALVGLAWPGPGKRRRTLVAARAKRAARRPGTAWCFVGSPRPRPPTSGASPRERPAILWISSSLRQRGGTGPESTWVAVAASGVGS